MANIEFSNYVESLDSAATTTGTILIPVSHDGDPESMTPTQIVTAGGGGAAPSDASETVKGIIEIATQAETHTGTDDVRALTPLKLAAEKGATGGIVGMSGFSIAFKNLANTFTSLFQNAATAVRTYTFQDRNGTIADDTDLALKAPLASPALTGTPTVPTASAGTNTTQAASTAFVQTAVGQAKSFIVAVTDEVTNIGTGTAQVTFRMPYAMTLTEVRASLVTAQASGSIFTVDINEAGVSILSTKLTIDNTELTSVTAATPPVISDAALADDALITVDVDQIGNGTAVGLKITLIGS